MCGRSSVLRACARARSTTASKIMGTPRHHLAHWPGLLSNPAAASAATWDASRNLPRLILAHEIGSSASAGFGLEVDIGHGEVVGITDDVRDAATFLDCSGRREAPLSRHVPRLNRRAARRIKRAPGITNANANSKNEVITNWPTKEYPATAGTPRQKN